MSDIRDPQAILQHRIQQRQILAMMGINQWVQPSSETLHIADIAAPIASAASDEQLGIVQPNPEQSSNTAANVESSESISSLQVNSPADSVYDEAHSYVENEQSPVTYNFDTISPDVAVNSLVETVVQQTAVPSGQAYSSDNHHENTLKVAPFNLQGGRYGDWVIMIDIQALNNDSQKLWQNITQALSITCETTSFPICEGMDTAELANASLAGYVFKIGRSEEIKVASLTVLPDGLEHPNLTMVPTLDEMLADSSLKRQLWEQLSNQS